MNHVHLNVSGRSTQVTATIFSAHRPTGPVGQLTDQNMLSLACAVICIVNTKGTRHHEFMLGCHVADTWCIGMRWTHHGHAGSCECSAGLSQTACQAYA